MADFHYRYNNATSNMILNDAYLAQSNPVPSGLHRRFNADGFNVTTKVWTDSVTQTTVTASGNITLVSHAVGDKQYRVKNVVQFDTTGNVIFNNSNITSYTVFTITRYSGASKGRIISAYTGNNWLSGHHGGVAGIAFHENWINSYTDLHGTNFFIGTDVAETYTTNGTQRGTNDVSIIYNLPILSINVYSNEQSDGQFLDLIIYDRVLTDLERKKVEQYLASYYGLMDLSGNLTANYFRTPLASETSLLVSTTANQNYIIYPSFYIAQTGLTFAMWFKSNASPNYSRLFDFGNGEYSNNMICFIFGNNLGLSICNSSDQFQLTDVYKSCNDNAWRHLVWTISADGLTWKIYINKVLQSTITSSTGYSRVGGLTSLFHPASVLRTSNYIGKSNWTADNNNILNGSVDDFQMYNYPMSQTEILNTWNMDTNGSLIPKYARAPLSTETSMLVSTIDNPNYIIYPSFKIAQTGMTFALWFKSNGTLNWVRLFDFGNGPIMDNINCFIYNNGLGVGLYTSSGNGINVSNVFPNCNDNVWRHLVWTISADGLTYNFYINKTLSRTITAANYASYTDYPGPVPPFHPTATLSSSNYIGKSNILAESSNVFNGSIHAFQLYNYPLNQTAINAIHSETAFTGTYTLSNFPNLKKGLGSTFTLTNPTSTESGLFTFTSSNPAVATITDNIVTMVSLGTATITASQGTSTITSTLTVVNQTVLGTFTIPRAVFGASPITIPQTSSNNTTGAFTYSSSNTSVATVSGSTLTVVGAGNTIITLTQAETATYTSESKTATFTVTKDTPTLGPFIITSAVVGSSQITIIPPTSNNTTGAFTYSTPIQAIVVATLSGDKLTPVSVGTITITVTQAATTNYSVATKTTTFTVYPANILFKMFENNIPDFYYRYKNAYSNMILNEAYVTSSNPVTDGLHRRFKADDFDPVTKIWTDSVYGTTLTATGNVSLVTHAGDSQYRLTNAVAFDTTAGIIFNNDALPNYTLFTITRYSGASKGRIIQSNTNNNWFSGQWDAKAGVAFHYDMFITEPPVDLHGTNFFIGTDIYQMYYTNGTLRGSASNNTRSIPKLGINQGGYYPGESSDGQIIDLILYSRILDADERKKVEHYLASYYGIMDTVGSLTASYYRTPLKEEKALLISTYDNPNFIRFPSFRIYRKGLTFSFWFKMDIGIQDFVMLFNFGNLTNNNIHVKLLYGSIVLSMNDSEKGLSEFRDVVSNVSDAQWRHFIWTISEDGLTWKCYINKVLEATINSTDYYQPVAGCVAPYHPDWLVERTKNYIGADADLETALNSNEGTLTKLSGGIDEFKFYNYPLDQNTITNLFEINTAKALTVNIELGKLANPLSGTTFINSNPEVATVTRSTITLLSTGKTTITSNLHSTPNPFRMVLTVIGTGLHYKIGTYDLMDRLEKTSVQKLTISPTKTCQSLSLSTRALYKKGILASLDGVSNVGDTMLTFGSKKKNTWIATGNGSNSLAYSSDGINWMGLGTSIFIQGRGLAWNGRLWVAGGDGGGTNTLAYSYDGLEWKGLGTSIFNTGAYDFAWNGRMFVAAGGNGGTNTLAYSYNGIDWTGLGNRMNVWANSVAWNGQMFVSVGNGTVNMAYSYDGITWTSNTTTLFAVGNCVRWNGQMWIAGGVGSGTTYIAYSYDGITWTGVENTKSIIDQMYGVAWNGQMWVGVCSGANTILHSYDGILWNGQGKSIFTNYGYSITWNGEVFMACGIGNNSMAYSKEGINWIGLGSSLFSLCYASVNNVAYENSITIRKRMMIAAGEGANTLAYSYDGVTWNGLGNSIFSGRCYCITWNGILWVAVGYGNTIFAYSYDGITWVANTAYNSLLDLGAWVSWNGTMWTAGGYGGSKLAYSSDGIVWTGVTSSPFSNNCMGIATNGKRWIAVGHGINSMAYSDNGTTWTSLGNVFDGDSWGGLCIVWNGTMFIAGGSGTKRIAYSYDGITWIKSTLNFEPHGIATNGTMTIAVGAQFGVYSYDGKTWTQFDLPFFTGIQYAGAMFITWNGQMWIVVGGSSTSQIAYSYDGIMWTPNPTKVFTNWGTGIGSDWIDEATNIQLYQPHIACGSGTNTLAYSYDGITWTGLGKNIFSQWGNTAFYNGSLWLAGGKGTVNTLAYSYDAKNWVGLGNSIFTTSCGALFYYKNIWLAGGNGENKMAYSYDGLEWTIMGQGIYTEYCYTFSTNGNLWLSGGYGTNTMAYSYDGMNWQPNTNSPFGEVCYSITWNGTLWVAVGNGGIAYSYDGLIWTRATSDITRGWSVVWNGKVFGAISELGSKIAYSSDGILWYSVSFSSFSGRTRGLLWTGHMWIIFAEGSTTIPGSPTVKYSFDGNTWITQPTFFENGIGGAVADQRILWDNTRTLHVATDTYYQSGYKTIQFTTSTG